MIELTACDIYPDTIRPVMPAAHAGCAKAAFSSGQSLTISFVVRRNNSADENGSYTQEYHLTVVNGDPLLNEPSPRARPGSKKILLHDVLDSIYEQLRRGHRELLP